MSNSFRAASRTFGQSSDPLWIIVGISFFVWVFSSALVAMMMSDAYEATTQPAKPGSATTLTVGYVSSAVAVLAVYASCQVFAPRWLRRYGLSRRGFGRGVLMGLLASLLIVPITMAASSATSWLWDLLRYQHEQAHPLLTMFGQQSGHAAQIAIIVLAVIAAPIAEEMLFRGVLQPALIRSLKPIGRSHALISVAITSALFALIHGELWMMPPLFVLSLGLGWVAYRSRNLIASMTIHACFNAVSIAIFWWLVNHGELNRYPHL